MKRSRRSLASLLVPASLVVVLAACASSPTPAASDGGGAACPVATACPSSGAPSYATEILPILREDCIPCHSPNGTAGYDESTYAQVYSQYGSMLSFVNSCAMPPVNGPQLTSAQRVALTAWLRCGAPDN